jgi:2,4-dienoyl-CoA reductase-like NADH-dependent reductase (Old Yellow Enzyme family)
MIYIAKFFFYPPLLLYNTYSYVLFSPMCTYSATDGFFNDFHLGHYASFALRGPGMIMLEATAVEARARIVNCKSRNSPDFQKY